MGNVHAGVIADAMLISQGITYVTPVSGCVIKKHMTPVKAVLEAPQ